MSNEQAMHQYDVKKYRTPDGYTADIAVFTILSAKSEMFKPPVMDLKLMLIRRSMTDSEGRPNIEAGKWALPGGFVDPAETAFQSALRELREETGVDDIHLQHFGVYDTPGRDPRGWIISNAHYAIVPEHQLAKRQANDDASEVELFSVQEVLELDLAFDHAEIISDAISEIRHKLLQSTVAKEFLPAEFTYSELQAVLLTVTKDSAIALDAAFARKIKSLPFIQEITGKKTTRTSKKPTQLYRFIDVEANTSLYHARK
ncbi:ADP-ribose pyrophosphatase YjhB (NUDIX family) [Fontibacillus phaseoli]|uniref:ADP-ribose pyrophosphatase YjhB (NUDIX family) n=1 Tax=Fontibacillus phaseoli TaxID=1416533 RepID=A0A369BGK1_9BACL|nr:NUDIX domain-containing protein [Fontibacillus phaseoli]RCX19607.1 ADP-ribose pyrophosphatase YjhB (NUDIX family) [Fontibacillus phaseoli]